MTESLSQMLVLVLGFPTNSFSFPFRFFMYRLTGLDDVSPSCMYSSVNGWVIFQYIYRINKIFSFANVLKCELSQANSNDYYMQSNYARHRKQLLNQLAYTKAEVGYQSDFY